MPYLPGRGVVAVGGASPAAPAIAEDMVDEYPQFVYPVARGWWSPVGSRVAYLRYQRIR
ncbi:hypothetical protein GCM10029964_051600 [Kibdelosporangium lantanae]